MVYIFLADGFEEIEALTQVDYLRRAGIKVVTVGVTGKTVNGAHSIPVVCDITEDEICLTDELEMVILPGGIPGVPNLEKSKRVKEALTFANEHGLYIAAICAAPTILAELGYLEGKQAVCYPSLLDKLTGADTTHGCPVVVDGNIITGEAAGSAFAFGLKLSEVLRGADKAQKIRESIYYYG